MAGGGGTGSWLGGVQGCALPDPLCSVQFHPEHRAGPTDLEGLFDIFVETARDLQSGDCGARTGVCRAERGNRGSGWGLCGGGEGGCAEEGGCAWPWPQPALSPQCGSACGTG